MRFDCAQTEIAFLRKRLVQLEERLESELGARTGLEQKVSTAGPREGTGTPQGHAEEWGCHWSQLSSPRSQDRQRTETRKCSRLLLMLPLTRRNQLVFAGLRINTLKLPTSLKSHFCMAKLNLGQV